MDAIKLLLLGAVFAFIFLMLKTGIWRRMPFVSTIFSLLLFIGAIAIAIFIGSILIFILLGIIGFFIILFLIFRIFGKARIYRFSKRDFTASSKEPKTSEVKKAKIKVIK